MGGGGCNKVTYIPKLPKIEGAVCSEKDKDKSSIVSSCSFRLNILYWTKYISPLWDLCCPQKISLQKKLLEIDMQINPLTIKKCNWLPVKKFQKSKFLDNKIPQHALANSIKIRFDPYSSVSIQKNNTKWLTANLNPYVSITHHENTQKGMNAMKKTNEK